MLNWHFNLWYYFIFSCIFCYTTTILCFLMQTVENYSALKQNFTFLSNIHTLKRTLKRTRMLKKISTANLSFDAAMRCWWNMGEIKKSSSDIQTYFVFHTWNINQSLNRSPDFELYMTKLIFWYLLQFKKNIHCCKIYL